MSRDIYPVLTQVAKYAHVTAEKYQEMYAQSINDPNAFWSEQAKQYVTWFANWNAVVAGDFIQGNVKWFVAGKLNAAFNCLDRHLDTRANQAAIIWEADHPNTQQVITYQDLFERVCQFANALRSLGVKKGDRVCIYLPMIPEVVIAMLACARIGAIHCVVFAGFSAEALQVRIAATACELVITANEAVRNNKSVPLKAHVDMALKQCPTVKKVIVVKRTDHSVDWDAERDVWFHHVVHNVPVDCPAEPMEANEPLFILYTSGSTGMPKGIVHGTGGYLVYAAMTHQLVFDYHENEIFWCTADVGWITGHTYGVYGPLTNGATILLYEGVPDYPTPSRFWEIIDAHQVNIFYTAPTALRALRRHGDQWVKQTKRSSLRILGTVGEPINRSAWEWYYHVVGNDRCAIVDTWWQTETGGIMISPLPGATPMKPSFASTPFFGVQPKIVDAAGNEVAEGEMGNLVITHPWPGMCQTIFNDHERFMRSYFKTVPGTYLTGDQAYKDKDGYIWIGGRSDDVIKVSGHRLGSHEIENALLYHHAVAEAAVVPVIDEIKGHAIYAFITLKEGYEPSNQLQQQLIKKVREKIGPIATPRSIQWAPHLPKTRSGKIIRRILQKVAEQDFNDFGDTSTLTEPKVIAELIAQRRVTK